MQGITFIGMSGSGKSSVGLALAQKIGWRFIDLDKVILEKQGESHHAVMKRLGEDGLKRLEEEYALELNLTDAVFAPPGSLIYSPAAMEKVAAESTVVYLQVAPSTVEKRLGERLYKNGIVGLEEKGLAKVMEERIPVYKDYAHYTFDSGDQSIEEMAEIVRAALTAAGKIS